MSPAQSARGADEAWLPEGSYRLAVRFASFVTLPIVGRVDTVTVSLSRVQVRYWQGQGTQTSRICAMWDASARDFSRVRYPRAFLASLATLDTRPLTRRSPAGDVTYEADLGPQFVGMAEGATVPRDADDPAVRDDDRDGRPGVTLPLRLPGFPDAELWIAQRSHLVLRGRLVAPGRVEGGVVVRAFEQAILAARPSLLRRNVDVKADAARSSFVLERDDRLDATGRHAPWHATCSPLLREAEAEPSLTDEPI
jgi:hypothetical protein